jgi:hypothetical protein
MMKKHSFIPLFTLLLWHCGLSAQSTETQHRHHFRFSLGVGYDDGLALLKTVPAIGLSYERSLSRRFALSANLYSYYRSMPDSDFDRTFFFNLPIIDIFARGASQPLFTEQEEALLNQGVILSSPIHTIKSFSLPIDVGITYYPIHSRRHALGFNVGIGLTYTSSNYWRQQASTSDAVLADGTFLNAGNVVISGHTEFNDLSPQLSLKLMYEYKFKNYGIGLRLANYGYAALEMDFFSGGFIVWDSSIFFTYKLP